VLYMFGASKPVRFHGDRWLRDVRANGAGSEVIEVDGAGHWFQVTHASHVNEVLLRWLKGTATLPPSVSQQRSAL
jgi:pimeloyl-ACP methyl ester carboxylesterase